MRKVKLIIPLLLMLFVSIGNVWGAGTNSLGSYSFTNGATMPTGVTNSGGAAFATSRFALKNASAYITIDNLSIPSNATTIYVAVNCVENGTKAETVTVSGLNSSGKAVSGASGTFSPAQGSNLSSATAIDKACQTKEVSFSATNVAKIKIQVTTFGSNFIIHDVSVSCDLAGSTYTVVFKSPLFQLPILKIPASFMLPHPSFYHPSDTREIPEKYTAHPLLILNILFLRFPQSLSSLSVRRNIVSAFLQIPLSHSVRAGLIKRCNRHISFFFSHNIKDHIYTRKKSGNTVLILILPL